MQYAVDLYAKSCNVADIYDKSFNSDILIESANPSKCHILQEYWVTHQQAYVTNIAFKTQSLLAIQNGAAKLTDTNNHAASNVRKAFLEQLVCSCHRD